MHSWISICWKVFTYWVYIRSAWVQLADCLTCFSCQHLQVSLPRVTSTVLAQGAIEILISSIRHGLKYWSRCPTECILIQSSEPWQCEVSLKFRFDSTGTVLPQVCNINFGLPITDPAQVKDHLQQAQLAILNPNLDSPGFPSSFLLPDINYNIWSVSFSQNCISLKVCGPDIVDLSFIDLPGMWEDS